MFPGLRSFSGLLIELILNAARFAAFAADEALGRSVGEQAIGLGVVLEERFEDSHQAAFERGFLNGDHQFDSLVEVAHGRVRGNGR